MALRNIVEEGDPILEKKCREVEIIDQRIETIVEDMIDTMHHGNGVGLAAPQVGLLKRIFVAEPEEGNVIVCINPIIIEKKGEQVGYEGCLSVPGYVGKVTRPQRLKLRYQNREGGLETEEFFDFAAVVMAHELDHLEGILYTTKAEDIHIPSANQGEQ